MNQRVLLSAAVLLAAVTYAADRSPRPVQIPTANLGRCILCASPVQRPS